MKIWILMLWMGSITFAAGELDRIFMHCCNLGKNYGSTSGNNCEEYPTPVAGVQKQDQYWCTVALGVCCREEITKSQCQNGKIAAQENQECSLDREEFGSEEYKQCCDCCQLGLLAGSTGYGKQCDSAGFEIVRCNQLYTECCDFSKKRQGHYNLTQGQIPENNGNHLPSAENSRHTRAPVQILPAPTTPCPDSGDGSSIPCLKMDPIQEGTDRATPASAGQQGCPTGYDFHPGLGQCLDINECNRGLHSCTPEEMCVNTVGSYKCEAPLPTGPVSGTSQDQQCPRGYQFNSRSRRCEDIDECGLNSDNCGVGMRCENEPGTFRCIREVSCGTGYTYNAHSKTCTDNDECANGNHNCGTAYDCINTQGSFRCTLKECPKKMRLDYERGQCVHVDCPTGFEPDDGGNCIDINECRTTGSCKRNQDCFNTVGSFLCRDMLNCGGGYVLNEEGSRCNDVDECAEGTHNCIGGQRCENRPGSFYCSCLEGFEFDTSRKECVDIDECKRYGISACVLSAECQNFPGSYRCICKDGFRQAPDNNCLDIDECEEHNPCHQSCMNTWGGYNCTCKTGYRLAPDKHSCDDVDECTEQTTPQLCFGDCVNVPGGYNCTCPVGFRMLPDGRNCQDIDECREEQQCNRNDQICTNLEGSFQCFTMQCPPGYVQDHDQKNRCRRRSLVCPIGDSACLNQPISYSFNFMAIPNKPVFPPTGRIDLFTMRGPQQPTTTVEFNLTMKNARPTAAGVKPADRRFFDVRTTGFNQATISLIRALDGPQEVDLEMQMSMTTNGVFSGKAVANIAIYVTKTRTPLIRNDGKHNQTTTYNTGVYDYGRYSVAELMLYDDL